VHDVSLRKVDPDNSRKQYHVHLWHIENNKYWKIASHYEYRPDFTRVGDESTSDMIARLRTHYRPEWDSDDYIRGKASPVVEELVGDD
jgi:hypothetical protein